MSREACNRCAKFVEYLSSFYGTLPPESARDMIGTKIEDVRNRNGCWAYNCLPIRRMVDQLNVESDIADASNPNPRNLGA